MYKVLLKIPSIMSKKFPLTDKKYEWAKNRETRLLGTNLNYNAAQQQKYERELKKLVRYMTRVTKQEIVKLFKGDVSKDYFLKQKEIKAIAQDESLASQARILVNSLTARFTQLFSTASKTLADKMLSGALATSKTTLGASLKQLSGGLTLKTGIVPEGMEDVSKSIVDENVSLIKSIPDKYMTDVSGSVYRSITTGQGLKDLVPAIEKYNGITERRATNIALDQTRKAYNSINQQRMQAIGVKQFIWVHSYGGQSPRKSHMDIDGKVFSFDKIYDEQADLGVPIADRGIPGQAINCRCVMKPVIDFTEYD